MLGGARPWLSVVIETVVSARDREITVVHLADVTDWDETTCRRRLVELVECRYLTVGPSPVRGVRGTRPHVYRIGPAWINLCRETVASLSPTE
jgi:DNA-binding IclR family transcriptional regulator